MGTPITFRHPAMREITQALGLELCRSFVLSADLESLVTLTVERLVTDDEAKQIHRILSSHNLVMDGGEVWEDEPILSGDPAYTQADTAKKNAP